MSEKDRTILVGPTPCDDKRAFREERLKRVWETLIASEKIEKMHLIVSLSLDLFREALSCYQNGAFMATILVCGVALETLLYDIISAAKGKVRCIEGFLQNVEPNSDVYDMDFGRIIIEAKYRGLIDKEFENRIRNLREMRNIVAHYAQKRHKLLSNQLEQGHDPIASVSEGEWASDKDAYEVLEDTAVVIRDLIEKSHKILCG